TDAASGVVDIFHGIDKAVADTWNNFWKDGRADGVGSNFSRSYPPAWTPPQYYAFTPPTPAGVFTVRSSNLPNVTAENCTLWLLLGHLRPGLVPAPGGLRLGAVRLRARRHRAEHTKKQLTARRARGAN